jgi:cold shock CspA family protein
MKVPLEIAFHNLEKPDWAEKDLREHVARLERIHEVVSCRVRVEKRAVNASDSIPPVVRIEIGLPGNNDIVVAHEPEHLQRKYKKPNLRNAITEAFRIAERRLAQYKEQLKGYVKGGQHAPGKELRGQVAEMRPGEDFGFLMTPEGGLLYFHRNSVLSGDFETLKRGDEVSYIEDMGDTGPVAVKVRVKNLTILAATDSGET